MSIPLIDSIIEFVRDPLDKILDRKLTDKNLKMEIEHEVDMALMKIPFEEKKLFENRVIAEIEHPNMLRDAVRPIVTYTCWGLYCCVKIITVYVVTKAYLPILMKMTDAESNVLLYKLPQIKEMLASFISSIFTIYDLYIMLTILGFWFGSKLLERTIDKIAKTGGIASVFMGLKNGIGNFVGNNNDSNNNG